MSASQLCQADAGLRSVDASVRGSGYQFTFGRLGVRQFKTRISL